MALKGHLEPEGPIERMPGKGTSVPGATERSMFLHIAAGIDEATITDDPGGFDHASETWNFAIPLKF